MVKARGGKGRGCDVVWENKVWGWADWWGGGVVVVVDECDVLWNKEEVERKGNVTSLSGNSLQYSTETARKCAIGR